MVYPRAMLKLDVSVDAQGLARQLGVLVGTQVPFATALALTKSVTVSTLLTSFKAVSKTNVSAPVPPSSVLVQR